MTAGGASPNPTIKAIIDFIKEERAFIVLAAFVVIFLIWPKPQGFRSQDWMTAFIIIAATFTIALICIAFLYNIISKSLNEQIRKIKIKDDLHAQVINLQVNFQTLTTMGIIASFLLSFFGIQTYQSLSEKQSVILQKKITDLDSLVTVLNTKTANALNEVDHLKQLIKDTVEVTFNKKLNNIIVAYAGPEGNLPRDWKECDSTFVKGLFGTMVLGDGGKDLVTRRDGAISGFEHQFYIDILKNLKTGATMTNNLSAHHLRYIMYQGRKTK